MAQVVDYGPDTEELLRRMANIPENCLLDVSGLNITSLPELPRRIKTLWCNNTHITELPTLPPRLVSLHCYNTPLTNLPTLPKSLFILCCFNTRLTSLPELPFNLRLSCDTIFQLKEGESIQDYNLRWGVWREVEASKKRSQERLEAVKEELMASAWHPSRVERWLDAGVELEAL
jgi:hypothetical protein